MEAKVRQHRSDRWDGYQAIHKLLYQSRGGKSPGRDSGPEQHRVAGVHTVPAEGREVFWSASQRRRRESIIYQAENESLEDQSTRERLLEAGSSEPKENFRFSWRDDRRKRSKAPWPTVDVQLTGGVCDMTCRSPKGGAVAEWAWALWTRGGQAGR